MTEDQLMNEIARLEDELSDAKVALLASEEAVERLRDALDDVQRIVGRVL